MAMNPFTVSERHTLLPYDDIPASIINPSSGTGLSCATNELVITVSFVSVLVNFVDDTNER